MLTFSTAHPTQRDKVADRHTQVTPRL